MKKLIIGLSFISAFIIAIYLGTSSSIQNRTFYKAETEITDVEAKAAFDLLNDSLNQPRLTYFEYMEAYSGIEKAKTTDVTTTSIMASRDEITNTLNYEDSTTYLMNIENEGLYQVYLSYDMADDAMNNATIELTINGEVPFYEAQILDLPITWVDETKNFEPDSYGDEALPLQTTIQGLRIEALHNNSYYTAEPLLFYFEKGENAIEITNRSSSAFLPSALELKKAKEIPSYETYSIDNETKDLNESVTINAIDYTQKNSSYVRLLSLDTPSATPFNAIDKKLNVIAGESWYTAGKNLTFEVAVEKEGYYKLGIHSMPGKDDFDVFRTLRIDGEIPFEEVKAYPLKDMKGTKFNYEILGEDESNPYWFYLSQGQHQITLTADYEPIAYDVRTIQLIIDHINQFALDIRKITGKEVDKNRTWKITEYIPETQSYLEAYDTLIKETIENCAPYAPNGVSSSTLSYLRKALVKLDKMLEKPDELPLYFEDLYSGSGSVNQMLGDSMKVLMDQPLTLNEMTFFTGELERRSNAPWLEEQYAGVKKFISSFTSDKYVVKNDPEVLNVWVNRPITHVDTLQKLVDAQFTPNSGIKVKISVMPDATKLILASAAGEAPDVAMGLLSYMPFDLAIRGAAYDLSQFDDFWEVSNRFTPGAYVPYILEDRVYALPETLEFFTTVYRKDIFDSLGFEVPNTWDEVTELLPELQRYGMNFFHPIAGGGSLKWFYQTSPFIYQSGGQLYSDDGLRSTIDEANAVKGLEYLSKLFTMYSLPEQEPLFYNAFRYGTLPIGIADFTTYMQIKNAAPELIGQWELAPYPGMMDEDGSINRWYIANGRGSVIMDNTKKAEEAWAFLKWWTSEEIQTTYSYTLQSIYGPEYLWLSSNIEAVKNSPIDVQDKEIILEQIKWLRDVPRTPGQYMLERGISDIWNESVFNGVPTRIAIDSQVITINREIQRKMIEFGYLDENGQVLKPYPVRDIDWIEEQMLKGRE